MSRLVAKKAAATLSGGGSAPTPQLKDRLERVAAFIPGEVIALYLFFNGIISVEPSHKGRLAYYAITFAFCLIITPFYLKKLAKQGDDVPRQQIVSTTAFLFWAYALGVGVFVESGVYVPVLAAILVGMFSAITFFL